MTTYRYGTVLRALCDDPHPENDVTEGDLHVKAGKHAAGDSYTVLTADTHEVARVEFETAAVYGPSDEPMSAREATRFARDRWFEERDEAEAEGSA